MRAHDMADQIANAKKEHQEFMNTWRDSNRNHEQQQRDKNL